MAGENIMPKFVFSPPQACHGIHTIMNAYIWTRRYTHTHTIKKLKKLDKGHKQAFLEDINANTHEDMYHISHQEKENQ